jgi:HlyD family secretion protein
MGSKRTYAIAALIVVGVAGGMFAYRYPMTKPVPPIPGMVRQTELRIAPEITGRLTSVEAQPGQRVKKGDLVAAMDNPDLFASLGEAKAAAASAKADRDRIYSGVRAEEIAIAAQAERTAEANLLLAQQQNVRATALSANNFVSHQELDESSASLAKAQADLDLKRAQHAAADAGPTAEERALADARVVLAEAAVADLQAQFEKTSLRAPVDGVVGVRIAEPGEVMSPGKPVMTIEANGQPWFAFTLREDALNGITIGKTVGLLTDDGRRIAARVTELRPLGEFATWRAARAVGDHDINSFRLRLDPLAQVEGLEPGMSVWIQEPS